MSRNSYTKEEVLEVKSILSKSNLYQILGISKDASNTELRKAYKKLAVKFHPDKNKAPHSEEAFKKINAAFTILKDPTKKRHYDLGGDDDSIFMNGNQPRRRNNNQGFYYEENFDPHDIFNAFFGNFGGFNNGNVYQTRRGFRFTRGRQRQQRNDNHEGGETKKPTIMMSFLQFLPIILLIITSFSGIFSSTPDYSFQRTSEHVIYRKTRRLNVEYFSKRDFNQKYRGRELHQIETKIESEYAELLRENCHKERRHARSLKYYARNAPSSRMRQMYQNQFDQYEMFHCDRWKTIVQRG